MFAIPRRVSSPLAAMLLAGCASVPQPGDPGGPDVTGTGDPVSVCIDAEASFADASPGEREFLASRARLTVDADWVTWNSAYTFEPGNILSSREIPAGQEAPKDFAGQKIGHNLKFRLPEVGGAPVSLGVASEVQSQWTLDGLSIGHQSAADLNWSPGPTTVSVAWTDQGRESPRTSALRCNLRGEIMLPVREADSMTLSASRCTVAAGDTLYSGIEAQTWALGYTWQSPQRQNTATLAVIRPVTPAGLAPRLLATAYEFGIDHRRAFGQLAATAGVAMRRRDDFVAGAALADPAAANEAQWVGKASLEWDLWVAQLTASWISGANPLWFAPDFGTRRDSVQLGLDLSGLLSRYLPRTRPEMAIEWKWSEVAQARDLVVGGNALKVDVAMLF